MTQAPAYNEQLAELIRTLKEGFIQIINRKAKRSYNMTVQLYSTNQYIPVAKGCFAFMFTNVGDTIATVNGMVIFPSATPATAIGDSRQITGHEGDVYTGNITLGFLAPVLVTPSVEIVQLFYTNV